MKPTAVVAALLVLLAPRAYGQELSQAKELYATAAYEQALTILDRLKQANPTAPDAILSIEQQRALCLLALNRKVEAEEAIEAVFAVDPFYQSQEDEVAPWVLATFRAVRLRVLPTVLQQRYARAKEAFDGKSYGDAAAGFTQVLALLDDPDLPPDKGVLVDLRTLARGFLDLSRDASRPVSITPPATAPAAEPPAPPPPKPDVKAETAPPVSALPSPVRSTARPAAPQPPTPETSVEPKVEPAPRVYGAGDADVTPPMAIRQDVPTWPSSLRPAGNPEIILEVIVSETGKVESAAIRQSLNSPFESLVLNATKSWKYWPASKNGQPVKYRRIIKVVPALF